MNKKFDVSFFFSFLLVIHDSDHELVYAEKSNEAEPIHDDFHDLELNLISGIFKNPDNFLCLLSL